MKKLTKRLFAMVIAATMLLGSSLIVLADDCPKGGSHEVSINTRTFVRWEKVDHHIHKYVKDGKWYEYGCSTYKYYFEVTQKCGKCGAIIIIPEYETELVCVPD